MVAERKKIVLIEDEDDWRAVLRITLEAAGYAVSAAGNGKDGLAQLRKGKPDLLIADIMMPGMNGLEVCRRMLDDLKYDDVPALVISAANENSSIVREFFNLPLPAHGFLRKPAETEAVKQKVAEMIGAAAPASVAPGQTGASKGAAEPPKSPETKPHPAPTPSRTASPGKPQKRYRILIVDDEEDIRRLLKTALSIYHSVETAENGMEALEKLDAFGPDFAICDINMPVMNGLDAVDAIRRHPEFNMMPVFFLTGEEDRNLPKRAFDVGGNLFLRKPIDPMRLLKIIEHFVEEAPIQPRPVPRPAAGAPAKETPPPRPADAAGAVRVLVVDYNAEEMAKLKRVLDELERDVELEMLWSDDCRTALGNLNRWQPDLILYNPRNPGMDGIAFTQMIRMKRLGGEPAVAFVGTDFYDAELTFSRNRFKRNIINLDDVETEIADRIREAFDQTSPRPKDRSIVELRQAEQSWREKQKAQRNQLDRQREVFRDKFSRIQQFIDQETRH